VDYTVDGLVEDNEIGYNNWLAEYAWGWEAGGSKFWSNVDLVIRNNYVHNNHGPGLWADTNNIGTVYEGNTVVNNYASGIMHEVSYDTIIRNNTLRGNGYGHDAWLWGSGILIASSPGAEIYGNYVEGNYNGITLTQQDRESTPGPQDHGPYRVHDTYVHDNTIVNSGYSGAAQDIGDDSIFYDNNLFEDNEYIGDVGWFWYNHEMSFSSWKSTGNGSGSTYSP
jgi:parallel beta-helix repeat protein